MVKNWNELQATGNPAVDAVMSVIYTRRKQLLPLKSLSLSFRAYGLFQEFVKRQAGDSIAKGKGFQFDGVDIDCNPAQSKDIQEHFYPIEVKGEA